MDDEVNGTPASACLFLQSCHQGRTESASVCKDLE